ncbi:MAG: ASCH domain-containing protein [Archangium sp.]|nr:ASCH domain-containing protein [Archangium sp.]
MLFQKRFQAGIVDGAVRLTFRLWEKPHVKVGGRYRVHPIGVVEVNSVDRVTVADISERDARAGGFASRAELLAYMAPVAKAPLTDATPVFRVAFVHGGDGDRVASALETRLTAEALADLVKRVGRLERDGTWVRKVMELIGKHPRVAASQLALKLEREKEEFKIDVRKLKKLGLTQSFEVGYEVTPRGKKYLALTAKKKGS